MTRCTPPIINPTVNCIMFMGDTAQPDGIKDHTKQPDSIIQTGVAIGDTGGHASIPRATATMTIRNRRQPFCSFPIGSHLPPAASS